MRLPFLAYAARQGFGWINGNDVPLELRERLRKAVGKLPQSDFGEPCSCGLVNTDDLVVVYRFMRETSADFRGRSAAHLALTCFPRQQAAEFNAEAILLSPLFMAPQSAPPSFFEYTAGPSARTDWTPPASPGSGVFSPDGSLSAACAALASSHTGVLRIVRAEPADGQGSVFAYDLPPPVPAPALASSPVPTQSAPVQALPPAAIPAPGTAVAETSVPAQAGCPWWLVVVLVACASFLGFALGTLTHRVGLPVARHAIPSQPSDDRVASPAAQPSPTNAPPTASQLSTSTQSVDEATHD